MKYNYNEAAAQFATMAHRGQFRRDGKTPYIKHPQDVVDRIKVELLEIAQVQPEILELEWFKASSDALTSIAWLHDVIEDTDYTAEDLYDVGFSDIIVKGVVAMTRLPGQSYDDFITQCLENNEACVVKLADIGSNLADNPTRNQVTKYEAAKIRFVQNIEEYEARL